MVLLSDVLLSVHNSSELGIILRPQHLGTALRASVQDRVQLRVLHLVSVLQLILLVLLLLLNERATDCLLLLALLRALDRVHEGRDSDLLIEVLVVLVLDVHVLVLLASELVDETADVYCVLKRLGLSDVLRVNLIRLDTSYG